MNRKEFILEPLISLEEITKIIHFADHKTANKTVTIKKEFPSPPENNKRYPFFKNDSVESVDTSDYRSSTPEKETPKSFDHKVRDPSNILINGSVYDSSHDINNMNHLSPVRSPLPESKSISYLFEGYSVDKDSPSKVIRNHIPDYDSETEANEKMMTLFEHFGISRLVFIFIEQEIDFELFLTLTNDDLKDIGIKNKGDRRLLLTIIHQCNQSLF